MILYLLSIGCVFVLLPMCFWIFVNCLVKSFLYQPRNVHLCDVDHDKLEKYFVDHQWGNHEGLNFLCLWQKNRSDCSTIIILHGNASSIVDMLSISFRIYRSVNTNIIILSYPGYSENLGSPSERSIKSKLSNLMHVLLTKYIVNDNVYLYGISFGGAVALYLSKEFQSKIKGLVLENTFISIVEMIKEMTGWSFVSHVDQMFNEKWNNLELISQLEIPVLFFCSLADSVIPPRHMAKLIENTKAIHSVLRFDSDHNDLWDSDANAMRMLSALKKFVY